jgi:hypothetical protein
MNNINIMSTVGCIAAVFVIVLAITVITMAVKNTMAARTDRTAAKIFHSYQSS